jgi:hypothetical protein
MIGEPVEMLERFKKLIEDTPKKHDIEWSSENCIDQYQNDNWFPMHFVGLMNMEGTEHGTVDIAIRDVCRGFAERDMEVDDKIELILWLSYWSDYMVDSFSKMVANKCVELNIPKLEEENISDMDVLITYAKENWINKT